MKSNNSENEAELLKRLDKIEERAKQVSNERMEIEAQLTDDERKFQLITSFYKGMTYELEVRQDLLDRLDRLASEAWKIDEEQEELRNQISENVLMLRSITKLAERLKERNQRIAELEAQVEELKKQRED